MSYLTSLNPQLFKNIAYVGSFNHFSAQLVLHVFSTQPSRSLQQCREGFKNVSKNAYLHHPLHHDHDKHCGFLHDGNSLLILLHNPRCCSFEAFESAKRCNICYCCRHSHHSFLCCRHSHHSFLIEMFIN